MTDKDLERWTTQWQGAVPPPADLRRMARREQRLLVAWIAVDWVVGIGLLAFAAWIWLAIGTATMIFTAIGIVLLTLAALAFSVFNWRGSFEGDHASAADFLTLALRRSEARLRYIRLGWRVLVADLVVIAGAVLLEFRDEGMARLPRMVVAAVAVTAIAAGILYWWGRREHRRAARLAAMMRSLGTEKESSNG